MDKKAAEAAKIEGAQVEQVTDANGLPAVKVSFAAGILFGFNSAALSNEAKASLRELAQILKEDPTTDIAIIGHTDKVGTYEANMKVSKNPRLCRRELFAGLRRISGPVQESGRRGIQRIRRKSVCRPEPTR